MFFPKFPFKALKKMLVSCNSPKKKNRVGRSVIYFGGIIFCSKICVFACFMLIGSLEGRKKGRDFFSRNLLKYGYRKQTTFFRPS